MVRSNWLLAGACLAVPIAIAVLTSLSGCGESKPGGGTELNINGGTAAADPDHKKVAVRPADLKEALDGWPTPAAVFVLSGEQHGYLEPCGCSDTQSGGVSRRADLFRQIAEKKWPVAGLDLGGVPKRDRAQSRIKYQVMRDALSEMGYALQALGAEELKLGPELLLSMVSDSRDADAPLPFVAANVVIFDTPDLGTPAHHRIVKVGDVTVGVTAILDPEIGRTIAPEGSALAASIKITDPEEAIRTALAELDAAKPDVRVLLSHADLGASKKLAKAFPEFDLIVSAGGPEDPDPKPVQAAKPLIVTVGHKGKYVGVVGYYPDDPQSRLRFELVNLDKWRFKETPAMREHMRHYQNRLKDEQVARNELPLGHERGATFVGAKKCGECHKKAFEKWSGTRHAHAFESLETGGHEYTDGDKKGTYIPRVFDAECLACHTTGWSPQEYIRFESGYLPPEFAESEPDRKHMLLLRGNQCENCHGPGSRHVEQDTAWAKDRAHASQDDVLAARREMKLLVGEVKTKGQVCYKCHDGDNSPHFSSATFDEYWEKIKHPWRD